MSMKNGLAIALCAAGLLAAGTGFGQVTLKGMAQDDVSFISGGVGKDEQEMADTMAKNGFNLQLIFAEQQTGAYLADVNVHISDASGRRVLDTVADGPMLLAKLPPGRYEVVAETRGLAKHAAFDARNGFRKMVMHWPATVDQEGYTTTGPVSLLRDRP